MTKHMKFFKRKRLLRRYGTPTNVNGYMNIPSNDILLMCDVQTTDDLVITTADGSRSIQRLKVFCDEQILIEDTEHEQKADRLWFQEKWFDCRSCRLSENTPLRHYTATFVECINQESAPNIANENEGVKQEQTPNQDNGVGE